MKSEEGATGDPTGEGSCRSPLPVHSGLWGGARLPRAPCPSLVPQRGEETLLCVALEDQVRGACALLAPLGVCHPLPGLLGSDPQVPSWQILWLVRPCSRRAPPQRPQATEGEEQSFRARAGWVAVSQGTGKSRDTATP